MDFWQSALLGTVQGLTEFIPVSSSGHLELTQRLIGERGCDFHFFLELINIGTLLALLCYFRKRIGRILWGIWCKNDWKLVINILITSIPAGILGFLMAKVIRSVDFFSSMAIIGTAIELVGILMIIVDKLPKMSEIQSEEDLSKPRALLIGLVQVFALIPGVSRSGSTILAGKIAGMNAKSATEYSFLASIPIMMGVCLKTLVSADSAAFMAQNWQILLFSNAVAFVVGLIAVNFVLDFLKKPYGLKSFGIYRVFLGCLIIMLVFLGKV